MAITSLTFRIQKNGAIGTVPSIGLTGGQTGQFEDTTQSSTYVATDEISFSSITEGTVGSLALQHAGILFTNTEVAVTTKLKDVIMHGGMIPWAR